MEREDYIINDLFSLQIDLGKPYREGGFGLCHGYADQTHRQDPHRGAGEGVLVCDCRKRSSSSQRTVREQREVSCASASPISAFSSWTAVTEHQAVYQQKEGFFSWLHKKAVRPCCSCNFSPAQLTKMYKSGTNIFLINFPVIFYRCCKQHWSYPSSVHCGGLRVCNRAQSILCSQFQVFAT